MQEVLLLESSYQYWNLLESMPALHNSALLNFSESIGGMIARDPFCAGVRSLHASLVTAHLRLQCMLSSASRCKTKAGNNGGGKPLVPVALKMITIILLTCPRHIRVNLPT